MKQYVNRQHEASLHPHGAVDLASEMSSGIPAATGADKRRGKTSQTNQCSSGIVYELTLYLQYGRVHTSKSVSAIDSFRSISPPS